MKRLLALLPLIALSLSGCSVSDDSKDKQSSGRETSQESSSSSEESSGEPEKDIEYYQIDAVRFNALFKDYGILNQYDSLSVLIVDEFFNNSETTIEFDHGNFRVDYDGNGFIFEKTEDPTIYHQYYSYDWIDVYNIGDMTITSYEDITSYAYWTFFDLEFSDLTFNSAKKAYTLEDHQETHDEETTLYKNIEYYFEDNQMKKLKYSYQSEDENDDLKWFNVVETYSGYNSTTIVIPDEILEF